MFLVVTKQKIAKKMCFLCLVNIGVHFISGHAGRFRWRTFVVSQVVWSASQKVSLPPQADRSMGSEDRKSGFVQEKWAVGDLQQDQRSRSQAG